MQSVDTTAAFVYNENGLRVQKTVNGVVTNYTLHGKNIHHMTQGDNELHFFYDAQNKPAVVVYNGVPYSYVKNLQGDIVAILDSNGAVVVSYVYDAWGRPISKTGTLANTLGAVQPFRYRGYVYDEETGLYYLRSRYYNPNCCRFINADAYVGRGGLFSHNIYAYCCSNPVMSSDPSGNIPACLIAGVATALLGILFPSSTKDEPYVGSAPRYHEIAKSDGDRSKNPNCYSYAIGIYSCSYDPGEISGVSFDITDVDSVADAVISDMEYLGRSARRLDSYSADIGADEYRIAVRVGNYFPFADYHFMVQTADGTWAEKHGPGGASVQHPKGNPDTIPWSLPGVSDNFYDSAIVYLAIGK